MLRTLAAAAALLLSLAGAGAAQTPAAPAADPPLTLQPGDMVRVQIYREPDLNGEFLVDENGVVVLPLVGEQRVTDIPVTALRERLVEAYQAHLRNPSISITPLRRVNVLGEVMRPGMYPLDPTVSLAGAVATAGGARESGDLNKIRIVRGSQVLRDRVGAGETIAEADVRSGDQIIVERRSWFDRNSTFMVSAILSATSIITSIIISN